MVFGRHPGRETSPPNDGGAGIQQFALPGAVRPHSPSAIRTPPAVAATRDLPVPMTPRNRCTVGYSSFTSGGTR